MTNNQNNTNERLNESNSSQSSESNNTRNSQTDRNVQRNSSNGREISGHPIIPNEVENTSCPVCFNMVRNRAYTDSCLHEFCLPCIEEWSQNHNRCPVCRQLYTNILHNIRSNSDYDQIPVAVPRNDLSSGLLIIEGNIGILFTPPDSGIYLINPRQTLYGINYDMIFLAPNQSFILQNFNPNMILVRPERMDEMLASLDQGGLQRHLQHHGHHPIFFQPHHHHQNHQQNNNNNN